MLHRRVIRGIGALAASLAVVALAGCGDDDTHVGTIDGKVREPQVGGQLTYLSADTIDSLDPGRTYRSIGFMSALAVGRPLYTARPSEDGHIVPDLADGEPRISDDRRTVTIRIVGDAEFGPPVNRPIRSADVKYAIERAFSRNVANPYAIRYLSSVQGAPASLRGPIRAIPGIEAPDDRTLVLRLTRPEANLVVQALALPISIPVPREYASRFDATVPSTYGAHVVASGPYTYERSAAARLRPSGPLVLIRNPNWVSDTGDRPAYLDTITIRSGQANRARSIAEAVDGVGVIHGGTTPVPGPLLSRTLADHPDQVSFASDASTRSIAFTTSRGPFRNANLRRAVAAALNRTELRRVVGGEEIGAIAGGWIPPGIPGYTEAGGDDQNADLDYLASEGGDLTVARKYMDLAARDGLPIRAGTWMGDDPIVLVTSETDTDRPVATALRQQLESLGFTVTVRAVSPAENLAHQCGASAAAVAVCPMTWTPDLLDPQAVLDPQFNGAAIRTTSGTNWSRFDDPGVNAALDAAALEKMGSGRQSAYSAVNAAVAEEMPSVPWLWGQTATIRSADAISVTNRISGLTDLSYSWVVQP